jgi:arsenite oxidase small subunit
VRPGEAGVAALPLERGVVVGSTFEEQRSGLSRRAFLGGAGAAAGGVVLGQTSQAAAAESYPRLRIAALSRLRVDQPVSFRYPLRDQPNFLVDLGTPAPAGVGPNQSIVAFSSLCQHMGCPVTYERGAREFVCPCHQTRYDAERLASIVTGVATRALPRVLLEVRDGAVHAVGVEGLIYGYRKNLTPGKKVKA